MFSEKVSDSGIIILSKLKVCFIGKKKKYERMQVSVGIIGWDCGGF